MSKSNRNAYKPWSAAQVNYLQQLAYGNTPTRVIGLKMGRTPGAIYSQAAKSGISLSPPNQSPYGRRK